MSETNLPPVGSVWLGATVEIRRVMHAFKNHSVLWIRFEQAGLENWRDVPLVIWHEWQANATCIHDPTAPRWETANLRRFELFEKRLDGAMLTAAEESELEKLDRIIDAWQRPAPASPQPDLAAECERLRRELTIWRGVLDLMPFFEVPFRFSRESFLRLAAQAYLRTVVEEIQKAEARRATPPQGAKQR